jgi:hypothetical protein
MVLRSFPPASQSQNSSGKDIKSIVWHRSHPCIYCNTDLIFSVKKWR